MKGLSSVVRALVFPKLDNVNTDGCRRFKSGTLFFNFAEITWIIMKKIAQRESIRHRTEGRGFNSLSSLFFFKKEGDMPVSKKRKTAKKNPRRYGTTKHIPNVVSLEYKYIHGHYEQKTDEFRLYVNMVCNGAPIICSGYIDPDQSYFKGIRVHNPKPIKGHTAQTIYVTKNDAPHFFSTIKAYVHTVGDLLDSGDDMIPTLDISNDGGYFKDKDIPTYRTLKETQELHIL